MPRTKSTQDLLDYTLPRVRAAMRDNGVTLDQWARACGKSRVSMSRRLNGRVVIGVVDLGVLADLAGVSVLTFVPGDDLAEAEVAS